ncbi:putative glucose-6-phosphate 1-epimerase [Rutidosis leptorrhynchoides]|uniref:putative glucose-6-phosphate 1-epimerase n=1 Tax=Rutidosis leptorrhynchoides TaxID=125765 RepID=UPI003A98F643
MNNISTSEIKPLEFIKGNNGLDKVILRQTNGCSVQVYLYGAHVTSWTNSQGEELLFVSEKAIFKPPSAIRGGIHICFPQYSKPGFVAASHGFARNRMWTLDTDPPPLPNVTNGVFVDLLLKPTDTDLKIWPHRFEIRLRITLEPGGELMLTSRIRNLNTDGKPFKFTFAYHNYFSVSDIREIRVEGLETLHYLDSLKNREVYTDQGHALTFESEVDRVYLKTPKISIINHEKRRTYVIKKDGLPDAVVWNPWEKKAKEMADFGDEEYNHMLCVGSASVENAIKLRIGYEWKARQQLSVVNSNYCSGELDPKNVLQTS